ISTHAETLGEIRDQSRLVLPTEKTRSRRVDQISLYQITAPFWRFFEQLGLLLFPSLNPAMARLSA
ncbi:hypothetical protein, partial [Escherichia coli]|uniref:hypothetical protein n=1 Tax=Escherichia coli TaxID=562 RepID=UPI001CDB1467